MRREERGTFAEIVTHPKTFFGSGPIPSGLVRDTLNDVTHMRPKDIGRMVRRHISNMSDAELAALAREALCFSDDALGMAIQACAAARMTRCVNGSNGNGALKSEHPSVAHI